MLRTVLAHLRAQWMGALALFIVIAGGTAYAADTIGSSDVINESLLSEDFKNNEVKSVDIDNNQVQSADVRNGALDDQDVGQTAVNFNAAIGVVPANDCVDKTVNGIDVETDHLLLTPDFADTAADLAYDAQFVGAGTAVITVCNPTNANINDANTDFNLLVFDAN
jgi:hypothetical protein